MPDNGLPMRLMAHTAADLNADCHSAPVDRAALEEALRREGQDVWQAAAAQPHLFSSTGYFISAAQLAQMQDVVAAVDAIVQLPGWEAPEDAPDAGALRARGVFYGYDFHLNAEGAHLIEINTNAGGGFLNAALSQSQQSVRVAGEPPVTDDFEQVFVEMFRNEWRIERGDAPLQTVLIIDEKPAGQYLYADFLIAQRMLERAGIKAIIADPGECEASLSAEDGAVYCGSTRIDLIYNRLTDFTLERHPALLAAWRQRRVVLTPHPSNHARYADKRNLVRLSDPAALRAIGAEKTAIATLRAGLPETRVVSADQRDDWWASRKQWFFKPGGGYGAKGTYRGANITRRVFDDIMHHDDYVAQKLAPPGERMVCAEGAEPAPYKADVRCYVYEGRIQLVVARLYQGQTTNFRTPGGGFALVRVA